MWIEVMNLNLNYETLQFYVIVGAFLLHSVQYGEKLYGRLWSNVDIQ